MREVDSTERRWLDNGGLNLRIRTAESKSGKGLDLGR